VPILTDKPASQDNPETLAAYYHNYAEYVRQCEEMVSKQASFKTVPPASAMPSGAFASNQMYPLPPQRITTCPAVAMPTYGTTTQLATMQPAAGQDWRNAASAVSMFLHDASSNAPLPSSFMPLTVPDPAALGVPDFRTGSSQGMAAQTAAAQTTAAQAVSVPLNLPPQVVAAQAAAAQAAAEHVKAVYEAGAAPTPPPQFPNFDSTTMFTPQPVPFVCPPPPVSGASISDDSALMNLLMAWYYSGFYTGQYAARRGM